MTFFSELPAVQDFNALASLDCYHPAPANWLCVITDVASSTPAIAEGRYRDVNLAGVASITAVLNALGRPDIPYVFGGDGAQMLIPPEGQAAARQALLRTRDLIRAAHGLELRTGMLPVSDLLRDGWQVLVARQELSPGNVLASFQGGGMQEAERRIKADQSGRWQFTEAGDGQMPDLLGLSCRWNPLEAGRERILSLLVLPQQLAQAEQVYASVLEDLTQIFGDLQLAAPVQPQRLQMSWSLDKARHEARLASDLPGPLWLRTGLAWLRGWAIWLLLQSPRPLLGFHAAQYMTEYATNSDSRKLDDALRMVLDCSHAQIAAVRDRLQQRYLRGELYYGLHESAEALLTCLVFSTAGHQHLHFVDGGDGGYAAASRQLKAQLKAQTHSGPKSSAGSANKPSAPA